MGASEEKLQQNRHLDISIIMLQLLVFFQSIIRLFVLI